MKQSASAVEKRRLEIVLQPSSTEGGFIRHRCILRRIDGTGCLDTSLWYELPSHLPQIMPDDAEPFLLASIMDAMREGRSLHAGGRVSFQLLSNLQEFMVAWSRWIPGEFQVVELTADSVTVEPGSGGAAHDTAVTAHTGGIDATSTLFRHARGLEGHRTRRITACVVVHGFLIGLDQQEKFDRSLELAQVSLGSLGLQAHPLRTNLREVLRTHWSHVYGIAMVSVLQFFKAMGRSCLVNAPKPYEDLLFPRGSNPLTDTLLSSDSLQVLHDGSGLDRLEKFALIAGWPEGMASLRVCWKGSQIEANCGQCEECIRTKLGFLALGKEYPTSLGARPTLRQIVGLDCMNEAGLADFVAILDHCRRHGVCAPWVRVLRFRIRAEPVYRKMLHWSWRVRSLRERMTGTKSRT